MTPYPYQKDILDDLRLGWNEVSKQIVISPTGSGKCLGKGTPILKFNGRVELVENIKVGDALMGPDSAPRLVTSACVGKERMYRITPVKGDSFTANESHILSLKRTAETSNPKSPCERRAGEIVNISIRDYLAKSKSWRHLHKLWKTGVEFEHSPVPLLLDPYFFGIWLGDGHSDGTSLTTGDYEITELVHSYAASRGLMVRTEANSIGSTNLYWITKPGGKGGDNQITNSLRRYRVIGQKHIPHEYKTCSREQRLKLLAGIIDTDGYHSGSGFDLTLVSERLMDDVIFVARSLGFSCYKSRVRKKCHNNGVIGEYFSCCINGPVDQVPCLIARKKAQPRRQKKNPLVTGFSVTDVGEGDYFGFELSGTDGLFLLGDFTVTHNTAMFAWLTEEFVKAGQRVLILVDQDNLVDQTIEKLLAFAGLTADVEKAERWASLQSMVVIGSVQTMYRTPRLERWPANHFGLVICDEGDKSIADSWQNILRRFDAHARVAGFTATPHRTDQRNLGCYYARLVEKDNLPSLIRKGYLSRIRIEKWPIKIDLTGVKLDGKGDYDKNELDELLTPYLVKAAELIRDRAAFRKTVVFLPLVKTAAAFANICRDLGIDADSISGEDPDRKAKYERFKNNADCVMANAMLLTRGFDDPFIDCVFPLRPTKSITLYFQITGRGTRLCPGKTELLLIDCLFQSKHLVCHPAHLVAHDDFEAEQIEEMIGASSMPGEQLDLVDLAATASSQREEALRKRLDALKANKLEVITPEEFALMHHSMELAEYQAVMPSDALPPTDKQLEWLKKAKVNPKDGKILLRYAPAHWKQFDLAAIKTKGQASKTLDLIFKNEFKGPILASHAQRAKMEQLGHPDASSATADEARQFFAGLRNRRQQREMVI